VLHDVLETVRVGAAIVAAILILSFLITGLVTGFSIHGMLEATRRVFMILGSIALFISAGMILSRKEDALLENASWKARFHHFGLLPVVLGSGVLILIAGIILDYLVRMI